MIFPEDILVSNLSWASDKEDIALSTLNELGIRFLEVAPLKIPGFTNYNDLDFAKTYKKYIYKNYGLEVYSVQAVLYKSGLSIFDSSKEVIVLKYFDEIFEFSRELGSKILILGSPKNRILSENQSIEYTYDLVTKLINNSKKYDIKLLIEANPVQYGTNFLVNYNQIYNYVRNLFNSKNIILEVNIDIGSMIINQEDLRDFDNLFIRFVKHVHVSRPYLKGIDIDKFTKKIILELLSKGYKGKFSIESLELEMELLKKNLMKLIKL